MTAGRKLEPATQSTTDETPRLAFADEWKAEIERRAEEVRVGRVKGIPVEEAEAEIDAEFGEEAGVELSPEEEEEFDAMIAETDADFVAGRFVTFAEMRAELPPRS